MVGCSAHAHGLGARISSVNLQVSSVIDYLGRDWKLGQLTQLRAVKAWVLNRNTFSSIDAVLCDTCNFLIHSINALIKLDTILLFMLNDVTLRCAIN